MSSRFLRSILKQPKLPNTHIPNHVKDVLIGKPSESSELKYLWQYRKGSIRRRYANFGKESGLKPGVCYPSKEELEFMKQYEAKFERSFELMKKNLNEKIAKELETRKKRESEIVKNLQKLPQMKQEFWDNYHKLYENIEQEKVKKEKLIQEVREYLGYDIEPNDPRFEEALTKKDEEEKSVLRAARKLEKQKQHMEMLQAMVSEALEKEKETKKSTMKGDENVATEKN